MIKYKIIIDIFAVLAVLGTELGCYYTTIANVNLWITILVYFLAVCEVTGDVLIMWYVTAFKEDNDEDKTGE